MSLPPYWESHYDAQLGKMYYLHRLSKVKQYEFPSIADIEKDGSKNSYQIPRQAAEDSITTQMSAMSISPSGQQTSAAQSPYSYPIHMQPQTLQHTPSNPAQQPVSSPSVYPSLSNVNNWSSQPVNSQINHHPSTPQPGLQQSTPNTPYQANLVPQSYTQPQYNMSYQQNPSTPYQSHVNSPPIHPNSQPAIQTQVTAPTQTTPQPYNSPYGSPLQAPPNQSSANSRVVQPYNSQQTQAGIPSIPGYPYQQIVNSAPPQGQNFQQPANSGAPNPYQQPLSPTNATPSNQSNQPNQQLQAVSSHQSYQSTNVTATYPNQGYCQPNWSNTAHPTFAHQPPPSHSPTAPVSNIAQPTPIKPIHALPPQQQPYHASAGPVHPSASISLINPTPPSDGPISSDPYIPLSSPPQYSTVLQPSPRLQMNNPAAPNQGHHLAPPNTPTVYTSTFPAPYSAAAHGPHAPYNNPPAIPSASPNSLAHPQPPAQHQPHEEVSAKGLTTSVKKFFKGASKGKIALGVGGALLAGLVGAEIGDGMSELFGSGAGVETADFSGFEDGGGGDVVYAETPADAGGYDPAQAQMEERMQAQMFDAQMQAQTFNAQMQAQASQAAMNAI
ncbi:hypothetical protein V2W45_1329975 [Cenococcum geophilum]